MGKRPGALKEGDAYLLWRHGSNGHWTVRMVDDGKERTVVGFGYGDRKSVPHRRALATRNRLQAALNEKGAPLTEEEVDLIVADVIAEIPLG